MESQKKHTKPKEREEERKRGREKERERERDGQMDEKKNQSRALKYQD